MNGRVVRHVHGQEWPNYLFGSAFIAVSLLVTYVLVTTIRAASLPGYLALTGVVLLWLLPALVGLDAFFSRTVIQVDVDAGTICFFKRRLFSRDNQMRQISQFTSVSIESVKTAGVFASHRAYKLRFVRPDGSVFSPPVIPGEYKEDAIRLAKTAAEVCGLKYDGG